MKHIEYLRSETVRLRDELAAVHTRLGRMFDIPYRAQVADLSHLPEPERSDMLDAIARDSAWGSLSEVIAEVEALKAATDDAIGTAGRLV